jgi:hypothetical protein
VSYLVFLLQWYNWLYLAGLLLGAGTVARLEALDRAGAALGRGLGVRRVSGRSILRTFAFSFVVVGLTVNGALHDYWPAAQERGFLPGLALTTLVAALVTRGIGRIFERHFPEIKAIGWGSPDLSGREGRVVSRVVSPDYRAGRAQVMGEDDTLHMVLCKTRKGEIPYGAAIVLREYDVEDGRYFVEEVGTGR